jgi:CHAT domain-containing protein
MLFAPDPARNNSSGVLLASALTIHRFPTTKVVVLASCESAAGTFIRGEGFDSLAQMFLDAGVPSVVASMWPVDDSSEVVMTEFHRQLRTIRDPAQALRVAQLRVIGEEPNAAIRRWAGLKAVGGMNRLRFGEVEPQ